MSAQTMPMGVAEATTGRPVEDRLDVVDMLRGFALFGILLINITSFKAPGSPPLIGSSASRFDQVLLAGLLVLVESKFFTLFSFLFGLGFAIQLLRAQRRNAAFLPRFSRRLLVLLLFGMLHVLLLWEGDILIIYALTGFVLFLFRNSTPRTLLSWAAALLLGPMLLVLLGLGGLEVARRLPESAAQLQQADSELLSAFAVARASAIALYSTGSYAEILSARVLAYAGTFALLFTRIPAVLAMFLLGLYAGKRGVFERIDEHLPLLRRVRRWGLGLGLPLSVLVVLAYTQLPPLSGLIVLFLNQTLTGPLLSLGYAASFVLLVRQAAWQTRLAPLGATGRMALTNYIGQSLICTTLFYGYGLGLAGQVPTWTGLLLALLIFVLQTLFSVVWLRRLRFGPLEWLWRSLTYLRLQPLR